MNVVVTGAAGFIGSHLSEALAREGHRVVGIDAFTDYYDLSLKEENARSAEAAGAKVLRLDLATDDLAEAIDGSAEDVLEQAFLAGNDLILTTAPPDWDKGIDPVGVLVRLAERDPKAMRRLEESTRRVLRLKDRMGLLDAL